MSGVHVIAAHSDLKENRILARKAKLMAEPNGWSLSGKIDTGAALNVFVPYLNRVNVECETRSAAYFTHKEIASPEKTALWDYVARAVDLRMVSSRLYLAELSAYGPTRQITPPLDREKFRLPPGRNQHSKPVAGTSGWVYQWGRKGEKLLAALLDTKVGRAVTWQAAGFGWPVPTELWQYRKLHEFYWALDVYVSTSLVEGCGYGPLEALASGVKVVIPSQVGIFDDLPEQPGVRHYLAGDLGDLERALSVCLDDEADPEQLRSLTEEYTAEAWATGWKEAVEELMGTAEPESTPMPVPVVKESESLPDWRGRAGLYVVAFGEPSRKCAKTCIEAFKRQMPGIPVALCAEKPLGCEDILVKQPEADVGARSQKVRMYDLAPKEWQYVLYLDADTVPVKPLDSLFTWLQDGWEFLICSNPSKFAVAGNARRPDNLDECADTFRLYDCETMMQLFGGMFAFRRCENVERLFRRWVAEWDRWGKRDQLALLRAAWHEPVKVWLLTTAWNLDPKYEPKERAVILHYPQSARRWRGIIQGRADSREAWARVKEFAQAGGKR